ncbi:hypothetical protein [Asticcacaulis sp. YBE204]|uniref:hypothetical protein n=1 Tax=Asticcacaulis sp. YBE204 TaxID=1282363 RepID=UPI0003C3F415|nr:hypothetical protein [Asticcacaulis sp. YBE204]ESQ79545.1 hypothetical protein AEYBE204_06800 [Asticcacaulis sp. YBE204]
MNPLKAADLKTPAKIYRLIRTETVYGGSNQAPQYEGTIWGDFQTDVPQESQEFEGETLIRQYAEFTCRSASGIERGGYLKIRGQDWTVLSIDEDQNGTVRVRLGRVH